MRSARIRPISISLPEIVADYRSLRKCNPDLWKQFSAEQPTLKGAVTVAALCVNSEGKRNPHQCRIPRKVLERMKDALLLRISDIRRSTSFDDLHKLIGELRVVGIGELAVYDIATRIGAYLNLEPDRIYLHAGTRVGAKNLLGGVSGDYLLKSQLPKDLRTARLSCGEIEDILCIYKDNFRPELRRNRMRRGGC